MITKLNKLQDLEILVVGDVMIDKYVEGAVYRMSPEAPVPVVFVEKEHATLGGAGNVVNNISSLGAGVTIAGAIGDDNNGNYVLGLLEKAECVTDCIVRDPGRVTTTKTRIVADSKQIVRVDREMTHRLDANIADYMLKLVGATQRFDAIIVSDYGKGVITPYVLYAIMEQANMFNIFVAVDPSGTDYSKYEGANIITPNEKEAVGASGKTELIEAAEVIMEAAELPQLLITCGKDGMALFEGRDVHHISTEAREVFDVSGAGDTVIAAFTLAVAAGYTMKQAAYISNVAAGIVVGKIGTATVTLEELEEELGEK